VLDWLIKNHYEVISALTGLIYLYFSVRQNIWLWPTGIVASVYSVMVFYNSHLYADMSLNVYYVLVSLYGWFHWLIRKDNIKHDSIRISRLTLRSWIGYMGMIIFLAVIIALLLINLPQKIGLTPSSVPWWDAFLTSGSIIATWLLARKILEQWILWVIIDTVSVGVLIYKGLYIMSALFIIYAIMSVVGFQKWKLEWIKQND
jgi:nicotinamide mononucleotide transporter